MSSCKTNTGCVNLQEDTFGEIIENNVKKPITRFTWSNNNKVSVQLITYGGTITSIKTPDKNGKITDLVMGFNTIEGYQGSLNRYFGATIGRVANRIGKAKMEIDGVTYNLTTNWNSHQLHGGLKGFDKVIWNHEVRGTKVILSYLSKDGEEGYPGDLLVNVTFELTCKNELNISYQALTTKTTIVNLTNHSYFNLAGHNSGANELYKHVIEINAEHITAVDKEAIPTGEILSIVGTPFYLKSPKVLGDVIDKLPNAPGFDHNFCIVKGTDNVNTVAKVVHPPSGRVLEVFSNQPGVQFYTSNFLPENPLVSKGSQKHLLNLEGKEGNYYKHGAFCLETQNYPDAINHKNFPSPLLQPGQLYSNNVTYKFSLTD